MLCCNYNGQLAIQFLSDDVTKIYFRIVEFRYHNLKKHHEIPVHLHNKFNVIRTGNTRLASNLCDIFSAYSFLE